MILNIVHQITGWSDARLKQFVIFRKVRPLSIILEHPTHWMQLGNETEKVSSSRIRMMLNELHKVVPLSVLRHVINSNSLLQFYQDVGSDTNNIRPSPELSSSPNHLGSVSNYQLK